MGRRRERGWSKEGKGTVLVDVEWARVEGEQQETRTDANKVVTTSNSDPLAWSNSWQLHRDFSVQDSGFRIQDLRIRDSRFDGVPFALFLQCDVLGRVDTEMTAYS